MSVPCTTHCEPWNLKLDVLEQGKTPGQLNAKLELEYVKARDFEESRIGVSCSEQDCLIAVSGR